MQGRAFKAWRHGPLGMNRGGMTDLNDPTNRDTVPAMLTEGEFVLNKEAAAMFAPHLQKMNQAGLAQRHAENKQYLNTGGLAGLYSAAIADVEEEEEDFIPPVYDANEISPMEQAILDEEANAPLPLEQAQEQSGQSAYHMGIYGPTDETSEAFNEIAGINEVGEEGDLGSAPTAVPQPPEEPIEEGESATAQGVQEQMTNNPAAVEETAEELKKNPGFMKTVEDMFGFNQMDLNRFALFYAGSRLAGGSHAGSMKWAATQGLNMAAARMKQDAALEKAEIEATGKRGVKKVKSGVSSIRIGDDSTQVSSRTTTLKDGSESTEYFWGGEWIDGNQFQDAIAASGGYIDTTRESDTPAAVSKRWNEKKKYYKNAFEDDMGEDDQFPVSRWASQVTAYGRKNLNINDVEGSEEFDQIVFSASEMAKRDMRAGAKVNDIRPYLEMARMNAYAGVDNSVWLKNPEEDDPDKQEYADPAILSGVMKDFEKVSRAQLGQGATDSQVYLQTKENFQAMWDAYSNPANREVIEEKYGKNIPEGMNEFSYFLHDVMKDTKISEEEKETFGIR